MYQSFQKFFGVCLIVLTCLCACADSSLEKDFRRIFRQVSKEATGKSGSYPLYQSSLLQMQRGGVLREVLYRLGKEKELEVKRESIELPESGTFVLESLLSSFPSAEFEFQALGPVPRSTGPIPFLTGEIDHLSLLPADSESSVLNSTSVSSVSGVSMTTDLSSVSGVGMSSDIPGDSGGFRSTSTSTQVFTPESAALDLRDDPFMETTGEAVAQSFSTSSSTPSDESSSIVLNEFPAQSKKTVIRIEDHSHSLFLPEDYVGEIRSDSESLSRFKYLVFHRRGLELWLSFTDKLPLRRWSKNKLSLKVLEGSDKRTYYLASPRGFQFVGFLRPKGLERREAPQIYLHAVENFIRLIEQERFDEAYEIHDGWPYQYLPDIRERIVGSTQREYRMMRYDPQDHGFCTLRLLLDGRKFAEFNLWEDDFGRIRIGDIE